MRPCWVRCDRCQKGVNKVRNEEGFGRCSACGGKLIRTQERHGPRVKPVQSSEFADRVGGQG